MPDNDMSPIDYVVRHFDSNDWSRIVEIWVTELPEDFCSKLGSSFLQHAFFPFFFRQKVSLGLVIENRDKVIVGFVMASNTESFYTKMVLSYWKVFLRCIFNRIFRQPSFLFYLLTIPFILLAEPDVTDRSKNSQDQLLELLYIAVDTTQQGKNFGSILTQTLIKECKELGATRLFVKTLLSTPDTHGFYKKNGFTVLMTKLGRIWFERAIS